MADGYWRDKRDRGWRMKQDHSHLCFCGVRVWNNEKECRRGHINRAYSGEPKKERADG